MRGLFTLSLYFFMKCKLLKTLMFDVTPNLMGVFHRPTLCYQRGMPRLALTLALLFCLVLGLVSTVSAQTTCRSDLSYTWKKQTEEQDRKVFVGVIERVGKDEVEAKQMVLDALVPEKASALQACRQQHENVAGCISGKYLTMASTITGLGFAARKNLDQAIIDDCNAQQGVCKDAVSVDPVCVTKVDEKKEKEAAAAEAKDKKGGKKK